ncbi:MAG: 2-oxo acid dehydrogenase subunit E2 [Planctomycetes bacterium]|nr:2-oxo acid dehydrogenase subunit E2 [Planctomycetota bacterium]
MPDPIAVRIPHENVNDNLVLIQSWLVKDGDTVTAEQPLAEVETSKATFEVPSPVAGVVKTIVRDGTEAPVGDVLCYIGDSLEDIAAFLKSTTTTVSPAAPQISAAAPAAAGTAVAPSAANVTPPAPSAMPVRSASAAAPRGQTRFSQKARELLQAQGLKEADFANRGLVRVQDLLGNGQGELPAKAPTTAATTAAIPSAAPPAATQVVTSVPHRKESLPRSKRFEGKLLSWSVRDALRSAVTVAVPRKAADPATPRDATYAEKFSAAVVFECARLLRKYPVFNCFCQAGEVHYYDQVNVGYALDAGRGLKVPVFVDADKKSMSALVDERRQFLVDYLTDELTPASLSSGTFTITDLSSAGVYTFDPLISEGQSAILGVGSEFSLTPSGPSSYQLILAFDHRIGDGRTAAAFLNELKLRVQAHEEGTAAARVAATVKQEAHCSQCFISAAEVRAQRGFLVQVVDGQNTPGGSSLVCTTCLQGW